MKMSVSADIEIKHGMTKGELIKMIEEVPDGATVSVYISRGDRPWESDTHELQFSWEKR